MLFRGLNRGVGGCGLLMGVVCGVSRVLRVLRFVNGGGVCVIISLDLRDRISAVFYGEFIYSAIHKYNSGVEK